MKAQLACIDFRNRDPQEGPNPRSEHGTKFSVFGASGGLEAASHIVAGASAVGLNCGFRIEIRLSYPASAVLLTVLVGATPPTIEAFNASGVMVDNADAAGGAGTEMLRLIGDGIILIVINAPSNEVLLLELCSIACCATAEICGCRTVPRQETDIMGLIIHIKTLNENLDIHTWVEADVLQGNELIAKSVRIASGEVEEFQDHAPAPIPFGQSIPDPTGLAILLRHPGISSNLDPHWRMRFTLEAITTKGQRRECVVTMQSATIYDTDGGGHLNFEGAARDSGRMPFLINF